MMTQTTRIGKQHLIEVAERLFTDHGYQTVSIRDIARACGVTNAALYYHFSSKEALFDEVIETYANKLAQRLLEVSAGIDTPREKLAIMLTEFSTYVSQHRTQLFSLPRKPYKVRQGQVEKQHIRLVQRILDPLENVLQTAIDQGELRQLPKGYSPASLLLGLFQGMMQHRKHFTDQQTTSSDIDLIIEIFWNGMKL